MINISAPTGKNFGFLLLQKLKNCILSTEAVAQRYSVKRCSYKFRRPATLLKKETLAHVFSCEFSENSKNNFSYRTSPVAASADGNLTHRLAIFPRIRALFSSFRERTGQTSPTFFIQLRTYSNKKEQKTFVD